jgi:hypothetical protein
MQSAQSLASKGRTICSGIPTTGSALRVLCDPCVCRAAIVEILEMRGEDEVAVATRQRVGQMPQLIV